MRNEPAFARPTFDQASDFWRALLRETGLPDQCLWLFEENLCFEAGKSGKELKLRYQTRFTPPPPDAEKIAYRYFAGHESPIVFYCIGTGKGKSLCAMLCDRWFASKGQARGFLRKEEWGMLFHPGQAEEVEEIVDPERWKMRVIKKRPLHEVDFSMTLRAVHETLAHGRILSTYEHYALKFLHAWKQIDHDKNGLDNASRAH